MQFFARVVARRRCPGFTVAVLRQSEPRQLPPHGHAHAYFSFLVAGSYRETIGSSVLDHRPPALVFHPPGTEHRDAYGAGGGAFLNVEVDTKWLRSWPETRALPTDATVVSGIAGLRAARALWHAMANREATRALEVEEQAAELLAEVTRPGLGAESRRPRWLSRVVERLDGAWADPPSMDELAREAEVHPAHLSRAFRRHVGCSPTGFVQRRRVEHVWRRLADRDAPDLTGIALEAGFADQSHCTRVFKRLVGVPPGALRREIGPGSIRPGT